MRKWKYVRSVEGVPQNVQKRTRGRGSRSINIERAQGRREISKAPGPPESKASI